MSNRKVTKLAEQIEDDSRLALDLANDLIDGRCDRELDELRVSAYEYAVAIDEHIRPSDSFEQIYEDLLITFYSGFSSKELDNSIPSGVRAHQERASDWIDEIEKMMEREKRGSRRGGRNSSSRDRNDRGSRSSSRRGNSRRDEREDRGSRRSSSRREEREDRGSRRKNNERGGFGKGSRSDEKRDRHERVETTTPEYRGKKAVVYDPRKFKLSEGVLVENYDEHELNNNRAPEYNKPAVESKRIEYVDKSNDTLTNELETFDTVVDFINCTPDDALTSGIVQNRVSFLANDEIGESYIAVQGGSIITGILTMVSSLRDSDDPATRRFVEYVSGRALLALELTANLYTRVPMRFTKDILSEWEEVQQLLANPEVFESGIESQLRKVFEGLLSSMCVFTVGEAKTRIEVSSFMLAVKSAGSFCMASEVAGEGILIRIQDDNHPELDTVATAGLEIRDRHFGDAWGEEGMVPLIVSDSTGTHRMVISEKASSAKFLVNS